LISGARLRETLGRVLIVAIAAITTTMLMLACGGDKAKPTSRVVLEVQDESSIDEVIDTVKRRLEAFGISETQISSLGDQRIAVDGTGLDAAQAEEILGTPGLLEFRVPTLDDAGNVVCTDSDGETYAVPFDPADFDVDRESDEMTCPPSENGTTGHVVWKQATATGSDGKEAALTSDFIKPQADVQELNGGQSGVFIEFTDEGILLMAQISQKLIGLPLGVFLDNELLGAPTVAKPITEAKTVLTGLTQEEAVRVANFLRGGALPAHISVTSVDESP
jgi:preprotein translocase subunit SecD